MSASIVPNSQDDSGATRKISSVHALIALSVGVVGLLIAGLQPLVLGGLQSDGRIGMAQLGEAAATELLALGVVCGGAAVLFDPSRVRAKVSIACAVHAIATIACLWGRGDEVIFLRGMCGICGGVMLWSAICVIARSARAERLAGVFISAQTLAQLALAVALPTVVAPYFGIRGVISSLALISLLAALVSLAGTDEYFALPKAATGGSLISWQSTVALFSVFLHLAFIVALWVYLGPLATASGLSSDQANAATAVVLAMQVVGGGVATVAAGRFRPNLVLLMIGVINLAILAVLHGFHNPAAFEACCAAFGFFWLFSMPFQTSFLIRIDPSRRASMQLGTAQLLGSSAGPLAVSLLVSGHHVGRVLPAAAVFMVASMALVWGASGTKQPRI